MKIFQRAFHKDFSVLIKDHIKMWDRFWRKTDILINGEGDIQQNLRFNIYHMLIAGNYDDGFSSIGARALSGEGYRGHVFWDAEIFLMPFYLLNLPEVAKNFLLYRYKRLDKARELVRMEGYRGAKFPWESASSGGEETPSYAKGLDGKVTTVLPHKMEHHITADVAYAVYRYYITTGDRGFMERYGYEMLFETARFWASRVKYNKRKDRYEIKGVIGPDEFHTGVNNNAFTNMMARWNLLIANKLFNEIKKTPSLYKRLKVALNISDAEAEDWKIIGSKLWVNIRRDKVIEQFDGYFKLKNVNLKETDEHGIYLLPSDLKVKDIEKTQLIKQADVLMLFFLLDDEFDLETKKVNFGFYLERTLHKSSLSPSIHSLVASKIGAFKRAYDFFDLSLRTDINNIYGNTDTGIHAASLGGTWQAVVFGFGGIKMNEDGLSINPRVPSRWKKMSLSLLWRQNLIKLEIGHFTLKIRFSSLRKRPVKMYIFNKPVCLKPERTYIFKKEVPEYEWYHY
ncbi:MAG: glycosyl hydrolase family 65 protein [Nitrospirota bacterium]